RLDKKGSNIGISSSEVRGVRGTTQEQITAGQQFRLTGDTSRQARIRPQETEERHISHQSSDVARYSMNRQPESAEEEQARL
ncbi:hypothetical protein LSH36_336g03084, partial [Paralvinella palmiformis]